MAQNIKRVYIELMENEGAMSSGPLVAEPAHMSVMTPPGAKKKKKKKKKETDIERREVLEDKGGGMSIKDLEALGLGSMIKKTKKLADEGNPKAIAFLKKLNL